MTTLLYFENGSGLQSWLVEHAATASELVVGFYKVGTGRPSMTWPEAVDEALCFGWIDGVRKRIDDESYQIRFTPRKATSIWSAVNIAKFEKLWAAGRVTLAGAQAYSLRTAERSVVYSYEQTEVAELSDDEKQCFQRNAAAWHYWQSTPPGYRKLVLHHIVSAKRPETRAARLAKLMDFSAQGARWR